MLASNTKKKEKIEKTNQKVYSLTILTDLENCFHADLLLELIATHHQSYVCHVTKANGIRSITAGPIEIRLKEIIRFYVARDDKLENLLTGQRRKCSILNASFAIGKAAVPLLARKSICYSQPLGVNFRRNIFIIHYLEIFLIK